ncbi:sugar kinase [Enterococcus sp. DIV0800]|uniref:sugar kinase n=1 Tax=unclassified Enterococcus TaxID=2608891 RepID=UPI003D2FCF3E
MAKVVTLGEIMLRLSTRAGTRLQRSESLFAHYGGGEANVAVSLANYGHEVYFASKIPDNSLGSGVVEHLRRSNVSTKFLLKGGERLGTYYVESGIGERSSKVLYDRAYSSFAQITENEWAELDLFEGVDIFHVSGITPALSSSWRALTLELITTAKKAGCKISFDINFRSKLWTQKEAAETLQVILPKVDYCSAGKLDALYLMGIEEKEQADLTYYYEKIQALYPNLTAIYSTKRVVHSSDVNDLTGTLWLDKQYFESKMHELDFIIDRVGGGDAFAGGILHALLTMSNGQDMVDFATAAAALKHTVYGDDNQFSAIEVEEFLNSNSSKIIR